MGIFRERFAREQSMRRQVFMVGTKHHATVESAALAWLMRLRSGYATVADARRFLQWRVQNIEHVHAMQRLAWVWHVLGQLRSTRANAPSDKEA